MSTTPADIPALEGRGFATQHAIKTLRPNPNLPPHLRHIAELTFNLAVHLLDDLADGPELSSGLRKLREAKDCFILQALDDGGALG